MSKGEAANLDRLGEEDVDRVREANSPARIDGCGVGLDLCGRAGLHLDGAGHRRHCRSFRYLHYSPCLVLIWVHCGAIRVSSRQLSLDLRPDSGYNYG